MTLEGEPAYDVPKGAGREVRMPTGRPHPPEFKAKVVMQVISGEKTLNDVAAEHDLSPNLVRKWRSLPHRTQRIHLQHSVLCPTESATLHR